MEYDIEFALGIADLDITIWEKEQAQPTDDSSHETKTHYTKWERANGLSVIAMKRTITEHLLSGLPETTSAKDF